MTIAARLLVGLALVAAPALAGEAPPVKSMDDILAAAPASAWRGIDPGNTLILQLPQGRVVIELSPGFAPNHVANIKALTRDHFFDGLVVERVQDNYVVQWGDPDGKRSVGNAKRTLAAEFDRPIPPVLDFDKIPDGDVYAPEVGFSNGFPAARDPAENRTWLAHCYGMVGAGRDEDADSGGGTELYAVIGHAPRHLDRNVTMVGRVIDGIAILASLPRGTAALGFYDKPAQRIPIASVRMAADLPKAEQISYEALRTDSPAFKQLLESRRNRRESFFKRPAGHIDLCNIPLPVRVAKN